MNMVIIILLIQLITIVNKMVKYGALIIVFNERDTTGNLINSSYQTRYFTAFAMEVDV